MGADGHQLAGATFAAVRASLTAMPTLSIEVTIYIPGAQSLKDKRQVTRSLIERIRRRFNVSVAELADMDKHQRLVLGIACISNAGAHAQAVLDSVVHLIEIETEAEIIDVRTADDY